MTKQGFYKLDREKRRILPPILYLSKHYTTLLPQTSLFTTQNPAPSSSKASLDAPESHYSVSLKVEFARIAYASQSIIIRDSKAILKGKSKVDWTLGGVRDLPPRLIQRGFEGHRVALPLDSFSKGKILLESCDDEDLGVGEQFWRWRREIL